MSDLSAFLRKNALPIETVKVVASERFVEVVDEKTGETKPIEWEIRPITTQKDEELRAQATKYVKTGKRGQRTPELDVDKYAGLVCAASTIYPNLNDVSLQDDRGVKDAPSLLKAMLTPGEYNKYKTAVLEVNGFDLDMEDLVEDAKN